MLGLGSRAIGGRVRGLGFRVYGLELGLLARRSRAQTRELCKFFADQKVCGVALNPKPWPS